jgi:hypothetical protein
MEITVSREVLITDLRRAVPQKSSRKQLSPRRAPVRIPEYRAMNEAQKPSNPEYCTAQSGPFTIYGIRRSS